MFLTQSAGAGKIPTTNNNECPGYDIKKSDDEVPLILELWEMWSTPSLPLLPGTFLLGVVVPDRVLSMGQLELFEI